MKDSLLIAVAQECLEVLDHERADLLRRFPELARVKGMSPAYVENGRTYVKSPEVRKRMSEAQKRLHRRRVAQRAG